MTTTQAERSPSIQDIERAALRRRAMERLLRFDDMRAAESLRQQGRSQRVIADLLHTTQPRVHRMLKSVELRGSTRETPEEVILRAAVDQSDRAALLARLKSFAYTFTEHAPEPHEGSIPGSWTDVEAALMEGLLSQDEYDDLRASINPPADA